jgi:hypothetical protein
MEAKAKTAIRTKYMLGSVLGVIGIIGFILFVVFLFRQIKEQSPKIQLVVPGAHEIELNKPGKYTIFYEYRSVVDTRVFMTGEALPAELLVTLYSRAGANEVELDRPAMNNTYNMGGRAGISLLEFDIDSPGAYIVNARYAGGVEKPDIVLAIGQFKIFGVIFGAIGIFFVSLIIAVTGCVIVLVAYLKSRKLKKEIQAK